MRGDLGVMEMMESHREFLAKSGVSTETVVAASPEEMQIGMQSDMEKQIAHNLAVGLLLPEAEGTVRYSWRGMFYIWGEFLRDFLRFF